MGSPELRELISGTRTMGHTGLFLLLSLLVCAALRSKWLLALSLGILTHLILDGFQLSPGLGTTVDYSHLIFWPLWGFEFPKTPYHNLGEQLGRWFDGGYLLFEFFGLIALILVMTLHARKKRPRKIPADESLDPK